MPLSAVTKLDLAQLERFVAVCDTGSMTAAARAVGSSQPAVSQAVAALEQCLGTVLVERQARPLRPSAAGDVLLARARSLLADAHLMTEAVRRAAAQPLSVLRLGLVDSFAMTVGPALIADLQREAQDVRVWSGLTTQLERHLLNRELDVLVSAKPLDELSGVRNRRILREPFVIAQPRRRAGARSVDLRALARSSTLIRYSLRSITGVQVERYLRGIGIEAPRRMEFDGSESVLAMVQEGIGWTITTPLCLLQAHADFTRVDLSPLPLPAPQRALHLVTRDGMSRARVDAMMRRIRRLLRQRMERERGQLGDLVSHIEYG